MKYFRPRRVVLGPCLCQGCGEPLWWAKGPTRFLGNLVFRTTWREEDGHKHLCPNLPERIRLSGKAA